MPKAEYQYAIMGEKYADARLHLFHGAHDPGKVKGTIELSIQPDRREAERGESIVRLSTPVARRQKCLPVGIVISFKITLGHSLSAIALLAIPSLRFPERVSPFPLNIP